MIPVTDDHRCRFNRPGSHAHETRKHEFDVEKFAADDPTACELYLGLLDDAIEYGFELEENSSLKCLPAEECSYRSPVGRKAMRNLKRNYDPVPWCGEILVDGSDFIDGKGPYWRGYFTDLRREADPNTEIEHVLLMAVDKKGHPTRGVVPGEQDRHMVAALDAGWKWCRQQKPFRMRALGSPIT